jgi:glycosyltransferase involved in cell wall biosynthesis
MARVHYSIVIPAYNEEQRISATLDEVLKYATDRGLLAEIIVADDGSTDRTAEVVRWYRQRAHRIKLLRLRHAGKGAAVRQGVRLAHGQIIFVCDADLHDGIAEFEKLEQALMQGADIAIGSRWIGNRECLETQPFYRLACGRVFNLLTQRLLGLEFRDTQCGLKGFTRDAVKELFSYQTINGWGFDPELLFVAGRLGLSVQEVGIKLVHDYKLSRFRPVRDGLLTFRELFGIFWRDLRGAYPRPVPLTTAGAPVPSGAPTELSPLAESGSREAT